MGVSVDTGGGGIEPLKVQIRDDLEVVEHDLLVRTGVRAAGHLYQCERLRVLTSPEKLVDLIDLVDHLRSRKLLLISDSSKLLGYCASLRGTKSVNRTAARPSPNCASCGPKAGSAGLAIRVRDWLSVHDAVSRMRA